MRPCLLPASLAACFLSLSGCVTAWRYEPASIKESLALNPNGVILCTQTGQLVMLHFEEQTATELCGFQRLADDPATPGGEPAVNRERRCIPVADIRTALFPMPRSVAATSPLMGASCGPGYNSPLRLHEDGTVRHENGVSVLVGGPRGDGKSVIPPAD